jgi:NADH dehydrogenase [ubiquinone] 1 alpha subcomplex assembly factor 7
MTDLAHELRLMIRSEGPLSVERYMALCLAHPRFGYYMTRDPIGSGGDFTTAPEISQMFGELIGLFMAQAWLDMGRPAPFSLVECGPGRGTLMDDALRAATAVPGFRAAVSLWLLETSPVLRRVQDIALQKHDLSKQWIPSLDDVPDDQPMIVIGNEFLDALPIRQYVRQNGQWHERLIGVRDDCFAFGLASEPESALRQSAAEGSVLELPLVGLGFIAALSRRLKAQGGVAVMIDYGHIKSGFGDTFQAMRGHQFVNPLEQPGHADLTSHVDFAALATACRKSGAVAHGPLTQGDFLRRLGIEERASILMKGAKDEQQRSTVASELARLIDPSKLGMGTLFKVLALTGPGQPVPPVFETAE